MRRHSITKGGTALHVNNYDPQRGVYAAAFMTKTSERLLRNKLRLNNRHELHCTLVYSREVPIGEEQVQTLMNGLMRDQLPNQKAEVVEVVKWDGHDGAYVVMKLKSKGLTDIHKRLKKAGAKHSFPDYQPHVTLFDKRMATEMSEKDVECLNQSLKGIVFYFDRILLENTH